MFACVIQNTAHILYLAFVFMLCTPIPPNRVHQAKVASTVRHLLAASILVHLEMGVQSMKVLREPILKTENEGERIFSATCLRWCILAPLHSYKVVYAPLLQESTVCHLLQGLYNDQYLLSNKPRLCV